MRKRKQKKQKSSEKTNHSLGNISTDDLTTPLKRPRSVSPNFGADSNDLGSNHDTRSMSLNHTAKRELDCCVCKETALEKNLVR